MSSISAGTTSTTALVSTADTTGALVLKTGASATTALTIDTSQNVGIGTSSPASRIQISGSDSVGPAQLKITNTTAAVTRNIGVNNSGSIVYETAGVATDAVITSAGLFQFNSGYGSAATAYGCRAWVNFNGTGTVAIRASGNVSSITDRGTGEYTINFTSAMPDANYSVSGIGGNSSTINGVFFEAPVRTAQTTSAVQLAIVSHTGTLTDVDYISAAIFR